MIFILFNHMMAGRMQDRLLFISLKMNIYIKCRVVEFKIISKTNITNYKIILSCSSDVYIVNVDNKWKVVCKQHSIHGGQPNPVGGRNWKRSISPTALNPMILMQVKHVSSSFG